MTIPRGHSCPEHIENGRLVKRQPEQLLHILSKNKGPFADANALVLQERWAKLISTLSVHEAPTYYIRASAEAKATLTLATGRAGYHDRQLEYVAARGHAPQSRDIGRCRGPTRQG